MGGFCEDSVDETLIDLPDAQMNIPLEVYTEWMGLDKKIPTSSMSTEEEICKRISGEENDRESERSYPNAITISGAHYIKIFQIW